MAQVFQYPNLVSGTSKAEGLYLICNTIGEIKPTTATDSVVGRYFRFTFPADVSGWSYAYIKLASEFSDVQEGARLEISEFLRANGKPDNLYTSLRRGDSTHDVVNVLKNSFKDVGGGWSHVAVTCVRNAVAFDGSQVFYIWVGPRKAGTTIDVAQPMVCVADEPHAWAPASGEVLS